MAETRECGTCGTTYEDPVGIESDWYCPKCQQARGILEDIIRRGSDAEALMEWIVSVARKASAPR
jgi:rubredoxin